MNLSLAMSAINVLLGLVSTFGLFRLVGDWRNNVEKEEGELSTTGFGKRGCVLCVKVSFSRACQKVDEWCGVMGSAAAVLLAIAVVFGIVGLMADGVAVDVSGGPVAAMRGGAETQVGSGPAEARSQLDKREKESVDAGLAQPPSREGLALFLAGVNSLTLLLLIGILVTVVQLKVMGSVLQEARGAVW